MTPSKEYEQARDAAMEAHIQSSEKIHYTDRAIFIKGATFATDYWAKEIEERDKMIRKLEDALELQAYEPRSRYADTEWRAYHYAVETLAALQAWRKKHE